MTAYELILYVAVAYLYALMRDDRRILPLMLRAFKAMCIVQCLWIPLQYVCYHFLDLDINKAIFVDGLNLLENASFIRSWVYYPSGLTWHSAVLAPMFVLAFALYDDVWLRVLILFDVLICGNSTSLIGTYACAAMLGCIWLCKNHNRVLVWRKALLTLVFLAVAGGVVLLATGKIQDLMAVFTRLWTRLFAAEKDASTIAHLGYYSDYLKIVQKAPLMQILFGYGVGCSGYPITVMYDRYTEMGNWAVECDIVNILLSRGIFGFLAYYFFLFYIAIRGVKINYRYLVVMVAIFLQGFGYNVQWGYVLMMEMILLLTIKLHVDFFGCMKEAKAEKAIASKRGALHETVGEHCCYDLS